MATRHIVAVYLCDRAYGGPEEGGWWYDTGELVRIHHITGSESEARTRCQRLNRRLDATLNRGRRPISSVLSDGQYRAEVREDFVPQHYPDRKPHYE